MELTQLLEKHPTTHLGIPNSTKIQVYVKRSTIYRSTNGFRIYSLKLKFDRALTNITNQPWVLQMKSVPHNASTMLLWPCPSPERPCKRAWNWTGWTFAAKVGQRSCVVCYPDQWFDDLYRTWLQTFVLHQLWRHYVALNIRKYTVIANYQHPLSNHPSMLTFATVAWINKYIVYRDIKKLIHKMSMNAPKSVHCFF